MQKIDIVYLWVDGSDKKWLAEKNKWLKKLFNITNTNTDAERYRDNGELKYSLRSIEKYIPWVNHIYIITDFNQVPKWLNTKNKKITIIQHSDIMPANIRPTFNSNTIEMSLHNIPNLSERFLLINDDIFCNRPLSPRFFFDKRGRTRTMFCSKHPQKNIDKWLESSDNYTSTIIRSAKLIDDIYGKKMYKYSPSHGIDPYIKSSWVECRNHPLIKKYIDKNIHNKFRTSTELQRWLFTLYAAVNKRGKLYRSRPHKSSRHKILDFIYNTLHWYKTGKSSYVCPCVLGHEKSLKKCAIFCINDSDENTPEMLRANINYLETRFPNKSEFEK